MELLATFVQLGFTAQTELKNLWDAPLEHSVIKTFCLPKVPAKSAVLENIARATIQPQLLAFVKKVISVQKDQNLLWKLSAHQVIKQKFLIAT